MAFTTAAAATAASLLGAMYLDAKLLIRNDMNAFSLASSSMAAIALAEQRAKENHLTMYSHVQAHAESTTNSSNLFLMFEGRTWTYRQFFDDLQRVGNWLMNDLGIQRGEIVALNGTNSPEYLMIWLALEGIGACPAFINCNLTAGPLLHCVTIGQSRYMVADSDVRSLIEPSRSELEERGCQTVYYDAELVASLKDSTELPESRRSGLAVNELSNLLFTSGTTGMPKGIRALRGKEFNTGRIIASYLSLKPGNRMYSCLPLYHGAAHGLCMTPAIHAGSTVVLSRKFSHKTFWPEVRESRADILQYVGELCRYLINAPPSSLDQKHHVKMAWGNGLRPDVWETFRQRFGIEVINELYAATDGLYGSFNQNRGDFGRFAIGVRGTFLQYMSRKTQKLIKIDPASQEILYDNSGHAIECKTGEPGEMVVIMDPATENIAFPGYFNNDEATAKRKVRGLFQKDDLWFRTGDLMRMDPDGCLYFVDRLGDTFRWKSENVSTNEVGDVMSSFDQVAEVNVYGIQVPFTDGRCGCAAVVMVEGVSEQQFDFEKLARHAIATLPRYAVPIFVRVVKELQYTGTMKIQKGKLREEGIDPKTVSADSSTKDPMYWLPPGTSKYVPFNQKDWEELNAGKVKL